MTLEELYSYIEVTPLKGRQSVFWGTTITPEHVLNDLSKGMTSLEVLKEHPQLTDQHIEAAFAYRDHFPTDGELLAGVLGSHLYPLF